MEGEEGTKANERGRISLATEDESSSGLSVFIREAVMARTEESVCADFPGDAAGLFGDELGKLVEREEAELRRARNRRRSNRGEDSKRGWGRSTVLPEIGEWLKNTSRFENSFVMTKLKEFADSRKGTFGTQSSYPVWEDDAENPVLFALDFGEQEAAVTNLISLINDTLYPLVSVMPDSDKHRSLYTVSNQNLERLGLKVILVRTAILLEYVESEDLFNLVESSSDFCPSYSCILEEFARMVKRTDKVFAKEMGQISGSMVVFQKHLLIMLEGPEIAIMDVLFQLKASRIMSCIPKGIVLFIMTHVLMRYLSEWTDMIGEDFIQDLREPTKFRFFEDPKNFMNLLGRKCRKMWKNMRLKCLCGRGHHWKELDPGVLPEVERFEVAINSRAYRDFHTWIEEISNFDYGGMEKAEVHWPDPGFSYPSLEGHSRPDDGRDKDPNLTLEPDLAAFLNGTRIRRKRFSWYSQDLVSDQEDVSAYEANVNSSTTVDKLVDQPSLSHLMEADFN